MYPKDENKVLNLFENLDKNLANFRISQLEQNSPENWHKLGQLLYLDNSSQVQGLFPGDPRICPEK
jgi:hypothetical protein